MKANFLKKRLETRFLGYKFNVVHDRYHQDPYFYVRIKNIKINGFSFRTYPFFHYENGNIYDLFRKVEKVVDDLERVL